MNNLTSQQCYLALDPVKIKSLNQNNNFPYCQLAFELQWNPALQPPRNTATSL